jgi:Asp-tRNA(Asn)/Glu-tRNA(Gln) amidotransferase A subunit family amidase
MRSPYGQPASVFSPDYVSGGSSSGSCVSVASNQVSFSLATDTAGSGRVPAALNNIIGFKPTRGTVSLHILYEAGSGGYTFTHRYLRLEWSLVA